MLQSVSSYSCGRTFVVLSGNQSTVDLDGRLTPVMLNLVVYEVLPAGRRTVRVTRVAMKMQRVVVETVAVVVVAVVIIAIGCIKDTEAGHRNGVYMTRIGNEKNRNKNKK